MNKIIASVGLVALGAANVHAQNPSPLTGPTTKWWNVQATVRGFYDDNLNTAPSHQGINPNPGHIFGVPRDKVWGYEFSPTLGASFGNDQTTFTADYTYSLLYYDHTPSGSSTHYDQDHTFHLALSHAFTERYSVRVRDSFVVGQEPDAVRATAFHTPFRVSGQNIVNSGGILFTAELTPLLGTEAGYDNAYYDYHDQFGTRKNTDGAGNVISPSLSGGLDRMEQSPHVAALWHVMPDTTLSLGYRYGQVNYLGDEVTAGPIIGAGHSHTDATGVVSRDRDNRSHTVYVGADHQFRPDFYGSVQAGASYYDYYNIGEHSFGPYARLSLTYVYLPESFLQAGFQEGRSATDIVGGSRADLIRDTEASVIWAKVRHRIVPKLFVDASGTFQHSIFQGGGTFDGQAEDFYEFGASLEYQFNPHISAHVGYDWDHLDSDIGNRSYSRNKVYIGATASY
jgi:predicted porin